MTTFNLPRIAEVATEFLASSKSLDYQIERIAEDEGHVLLKAVNLFSVLYCEVTADPQRISAWADLQEELYKREGKRANRYLIYLVPDSVVSRSGLFKELARAERDDLLFRKVFVGLAEKASKKAIVSSLRDRIPLWFAQTTEVLRQYLPVMADAIPDRNLVELILREQPKAVFEIIQKDAQYRYLFADRGETKCDDRGPAEAAPASHASSRTRLTGLRVENFRCFDDRDFDLNANVVLVCGSNGTGKTTLCDALELSMFPELQRLQGDPDVGKQKGGPYTPYIRAGAASDEAIITMRGVSRDVPFEIQTLITPQKTTRALDRKNLSNEEILSWLTDNDSVAKPGFMDILLHTHFLGQHSIRDFIYGNRLNDDQKTTTTTARYGLVAEMFGFGQVEQVKKRLTSLLSYVKRAGINDAQTHIDAANGQIRSMRRKYGPKCKANLEKDGHQIDMAYAVPRYREEVERLPASLGFDSDHILRSPSSPNEYRQSCAGIKSHLVNKVKILRSRNVELKVLGQLLAKLSNAVQVEPCTKTSLTSYIEVVREKMSGVLADAQRLRSEIQSAADTVDTHLDAKTRLKTFADNHERYRGLVAAIAEQSAAQQKMQAARLALTERRRSLASALNAARREKETKTTEIKKTRLKIGSYEQLASALADYKAAKKTYAENSHKIQVLDEAIASAQSKLIELGQPDQEAPLESRLEGLVSGLQLKIDGIERCPCCGTAFDDPRTLRDRVILQVERGIYAEELRQFIADMAARSLASAKSATAETIRAKTREKLAVEQVNRGLTVQMQAIRYQAEALGYATIPTAADVRAAIQKHTREVTYAQRALANSEDTSLGRQIEALDEELLKLASSFNTADLNNAKKEARQLVSTVEDILPKDAMLASEQIIELVEFHSQGLSAAREKARALKSSFDGLLPLEQRAEEIAKWMSQIESLMISLGGAADLPSEGVDVVAKANFDEQKLCYGLSAVFDDLVMLFGVLASQEQSDVLSATVAKYEKERDRWMVCHQNIEKMNTQISADSYKGLLNSLEEYGPLINHIYRKFIRHDYFGDLVLDFRLAKKARRGDLFLHLRSHEGRSEFTPASYLSEAQLNVLALSIFLTRVMYQNISALDTIFVDDPIQQMDDMNTAAFIDVVLGLSRLGKQIVLTTCNHDFYRLLIHKLHDACIDGSITLKTIDLNAAGENANTHG